MPPEIAFVMDPITGIKPAKDSTVALIRAAQNKSARCYYIGIDDLFIQDGRAFCMAAPITVTENPEKWALVDEARRHDFDAFDIVMMRKDPPVDKRFIHACYVLELAARAGTRVLNNPTTLILKNEKLYAGDFPDFCPPTLVTDDHSLIREFLNLHKKIIIKPLDAMGGAGVFMLTQDDPNFDVVWELETNHGRTPIMAQAFLPEISDGDIRVVIINGKPFEHVLVRTPKKGSLRGNMAAGGHHHVRPISKVERELASSVGERIVEQGIFFAGIDVIGNKLTEINITSPTGLQEISKGCGIDVAALMLDKLL